MHGFDDRLVLHCYHQPRPLSRPATFLDREGYRVVCKCADRFITLFRRASPAFTAACWRGASFTTVRLCAVLADATPATSSSHRINGSGSRRTRRVVASLIISFLRVYRFLTSSRLASVTRTYTYAPSSREKLRVRSKSAFLPPNVDFKRTDSIRANLRDENNKFHFDTEDRYDQLLLLRKFIFTLNSIGVTRALY